MGFCWDLMILMWCGGWWKGGNMVSWGWGKERHGVRKKTKTKDWIRLRRLDFFSVKKLIFPWELMEFLPRFFLEKQSLSANGFFRGWKPLNGFLQKKWAIFFFRGESNIKSHFASNRAGPTFCLREVTEYWDFLSLTWRLDFRVWNF